MQLLYKFLSRISLVASLIPLSISVSAQQTKPAMMSEVPNHHFPPEVQQAVVLPYLTPPVPPIKNKTAGLLMNTLRPTHKYTMLPLALNDTIIRGGFGRGAWIGALVGLGIGSLFGLAMPEDTGTWVILTREANMLIGAIGGTISGAIIGGFVGVGNKRKKLRQIDRLRH